MSDWHVRAFCGSCGYDFGVPSFGDIWFIQTHNPVCPSCGASKYGYTTHVARWVSLGWFKGSKLEFQDEARAALDASREK